MGAKASLILSILLLFLSYIVIPADVTAREMLQEPQTGRTTHKALKGGPAASKGRPFREPGCQKTYTCRGGGHPGHVITPIKPAPAPKGKPYNRPGIPYNPPLQGKPYNRPGIPYNPPLQGKPYNRPGIPYNRPLQGKPYNRPGIPHKVGHSVPNNCTNYLCAKGKPYNRPGMPYNPPRQGKPYNRPGIPYNPPRQGKPYNRPGIPYNRPKGKPYKRPGIPYNPPRHQYTRPCKSNRFCRPPAP